MNNAEAIAMEHDQKELRRRTVLKQIATVAALGVTTAKAEPLGESEAQVPGPTKHVLPEAGHETRRLADYATSVRYDDLPPAVIQRAKDCIIDTVGVIIYGADLPWSKMIVAYARHNGAGGSSFILGAGGDPVHAPFAALANGALTHAFELDNLTKPDSGSHLGATLFAPALAVAQERGIGGRDLVTAFVAGAEVMIRIGRATKHTNEARGFHAPGTTGPFGAAVAVGKLRGLDADQMTNALGIAGSLASGLLEFAHSDGAMVKRLHLGRAAEGGALAASLAAEGFTGPSTVLEGRYGFLPVFCTDYDLAALTSGLGTDYVTMTAMIKRFACHITAHNPVEATLDLKEEHKFSGTDVAAINIAGNERMAKVNNIPAPKDVMLAQYSIPFSVALSVYRDPRDPRSFDETAVHDPDIRALAKLVTMSIVEGQDRRDLACTVTIVLKEGRVLTRRVTEFRGTPERPLDKEGLQEKFMLLTRHLDRTKMEHLFGRLQQIEVERDLAWLKV
jgi:2-methylcitrate dehydratase PrpD